MNTQLLKYTGFVSLAFFAPLADAHTGHVDGGFLWGLAHPFMGIDHVLAILAAGIWAGKTGGNARWQIPACYMAVMAIAAIAFIGTTGMPMVENGIAVSVFLLGLLVAFAIRMSAISGALLVMAFAVFHGAAHGMEMFAAASPLAYISGLLVATAVIQAIGVFIGIASKTGMTAQAVRLAGVAVAGAGGYMLLAS